MEGCLGLDQPNDSWEGIDVFSLKQLVGGSPSRRHAVKGIFRSQLSHFLPYTADITYLLA